MQDKLSSRSPVFVTRSVLPPLEDYLECVRAIFQSHQLTNQGCYTNTLEQRLTHFLDVPALALCANGTLALQLALRLLKLNGKTVITTPFTYVATLSALLWEGCSPIFADIDPHTLCLDPADVERKIKAHPDVAGILPVHVYGNACDVSGMESLAKKYGLRVLYDAAHAFGCTLNGQSLFRWGDAATGSFHATKLFHTVEGGCIVSPHADDLKELSLLRAFGHCDDEHICLGINAKMSELHAAMGVCLLPAVPDILARRTRCCDLYDAELPWGELALRRPVHAPGLVWNRAYYPIIFPNHASLQRALTALAAKEIHPRRYFYPSLTKLPYFPGQACPVAEDMADRVLCLPLWPGMEAALIREIAAEIREVL